MSILDGGTARERRRRWTSGARRSGTDLHIRIDAVYLVSDETATLGIH